MLIAGGLTGMLTVMRRVCDSLRDEAFLGPMLRVVGALSLELVD